MFFTQANVLTLANSAPVDLPELLIKSLANYEYADPGVHTIESYGFVPPLDSSLVHIAKDKILLCFQSGVRNLPSAEVNTALKDKVSQIEREELRKVGKLEKAELKEKIVKNLLPQCFIKRTKRYGYIDQENRLVVLNSNVDKDSELFNSYIRRALGSWPVLPLQGNSNPGLILTEWLTSGELPYFTFGDYLKLKTASSKSSTATFKKQEITSDLLISFIEENNARVKEIELYLSGRMSFVLTDDLLIKSIQYDTELMTENDDIPKEDALAKQEADFLISAEEIAYLVSILNKHFTKKTKHI